MNIALYHSKMVMSKRPAVDLQQDNKPSVPSDDDNKDRNEAINDKVSISSIGLKKSRESASEAEQQLPPHIQQLKEQIRQIKQQIEEQQQKIAELEQSQMSDELKQATKETYLEQLMSLQSSLALTSIALQEAIKEAGITDPLVLMEALA